MKNKNQKNHSPYITASEAVKLINASAERSVEQFALIVGRGFKDVNSKIDQLDNKIDSKIEQLDNKIDTKIDQLDNKIDSKIEQLNIKIDLVNKNLSERMDYVGANLSEKIKEVDERLSNSIELLSNKISGTNLRINDLAFNRVNYDDHNRLEKRVEKLERKVFPE